MPNNWWAVTSKHSQLFSTACTNVAIQFTIIKMPSIKLHLIPFTLTSWNLIASKKKINNMFKIISEVYLMPNCLKVRFKLAFKSTFRSILKAVLNHLVASNGLLILILHEMLILGIGPKNIWNLYLMRFIQLLNSTQDN